MQDAKIAMIARRKLVAIKVAAGSSAADAGKWADEHLNAAVARVQAVPKGTDPFAVLATWVGGSR